MQGSENCGQRLWTDLQKSTVFRERDATTPIWGSKLPLETRASPQFSGRANTPEQAQRSAEAAFSCSPRGSGKPDRDSFDTDNMVEGMLLSSKLLLIGRIPEFAVGSICSKDWRYRKHPG